jgi:hypothetical protein
MEDDDTTTVATGSSGRRIAFKVFAAIFAAAALGGLFGIGVIVAWIDTDEGGIHRVHDMGFGALYGVILAVGFAVQLWRPERKISAFFQILAVGLAASIAGALAGRAYALLGVFIVLAWAILLALHPHRSEVRRPRRDGVSPWLGGLAALGTIPWLWFAWTVAKLQRNGLDLDPHVNQDHWTTMAAMAIGIVLVGWLSCLKLRGWRISAWCAGAATFLYGLISAVYPGRAGSEGTRWGWTAIAGGLVFIAAGEWEARRSVEAAVHQRGITRP